MKRGDYVRLPDGRVGIYSANIGYLMCRVVMPDWSIETPFKADLKLIGASNSGSIITGLHIQDPKPASSGVWIFTDKWYKTQSQWEGGYFVEGKWVSPKEVNGIEKEEDWKFQLKVGDIIQIKSNNRNLIVYGPWHVNPKEYSTSFQDALILRPVYPTEIEKKVDHFPEKMIDHNKSTYVCGADVKGRENIPVPEEASKEEVDEFTKKFERFMDENKPISPPKVGDYVRCDEAEGYVTHVDDEVVKFTDKSGTVFTAPITDVDIINKPYREESFNPGDRVATPYGEGVVEEAYPSYMIVKINGSLRWVNYEEMKPEEKKMSPGWNDIYTEVGGLMWKTGEAELDTVLHMINDYSAFWVEAQGVKDSNRYVAKKLLEKYTIHRK